MVLTTAQARIAARSYGVLAILFGLAPLGVAVFLLWAFGIRTADWRLFAYLVLPGLVFVALGVVIWRQQTWAMLAALALAVAFRFVLGSPNAGLGALLVAAPVVFAVLTGVCLLGEER